ncbi:MAG: lysine--tRNA ligase [Nanoarchaeota archaeon]
MLKKLEIDPNKLQKLRELEDSGVNPYPYTFSQSHHAREINEKYSTLKSEGRTDVRVSIAGRIVLKRVMGKASFLHIQDETGRVQLYLNTNNLGDEKYQFLVKKTDLGDIIGVEGIIFKTRMGEVTIEVHSADILCKSLLMLPEKFHGLKEIELKYRQRYLDLITNPESKEVFRKRSRMIEVIREYFKEKGFIEVETPTLQTIYGGAKAKPFVTHINTWNMKMYLSISPELFLKRLLVGGFEKIFTIGKNFRNEDVDTTHNPEFTMLEVYQAYVDYNTMMTYLEEIYEKACIALNGSAQVKQVYRGEEVVLNFKAPWKRMSMIEAIKHYAHIDVSRMTEKHIKSLVEKHNIGYEGKFTWGLGVQLLFEEFVEDKLVQPVHIFDFPKETTPLCKLSRNDSRLVERFESFCLGMELCNAYSELNDPILQRKLLEEQAQQLRGGSEEAHPMDEDFVNALEYGMPPAGGLGFGIDRMAVILTGQDAIRDVILFPTVKPVEEETGGNERTGNRTCSSLKADEKKEEVCLPRLKNKKSEKKKKKKKNK